MLTGRVYAYIACVDISMRAIFLRVKGTGYRSAKWKNIPNIIVIIAFIFHLSPFFCGEAKMNDEGFRDDRNCPRIQSF